MGVSRWRQSGSGRAQLPILPQSWPHRCSCLGTWSPEPRVLGQRLTLSPPPPIAAAAGTARAL